MALKAYQQCIIAQLIRAGMPKPVIRAMLTIDMRTLQGYIDENNLQVREDTIAIPRKETPHAIYRAAKTIVERHRLYDMMDILDGLTKGERALLCREVAQLLESAPREKKPANGTKGET